MPSDSTQQVTGPGGQQLKLVSNAIEDFTSGGFGPEQADVRILSAEYIAFDYGGRMKDDPVLAVKMNLLPLDGSNNGKEFEANWTTGGKMSEFSIVNNGGHVAVLGSKENLGLTSNWGLFLESLKNCSFPSSINQGQNGILAMAGMEMTIRRVKQPVREGMKNQSQDQEKDNKQYYMCLKLTTLPGEQGKKKSATRAKANGAAAPAASAPAAAPAQANGTTSASGDTISYISAALAANDNKIPMSLLQAAVFKAGQASGLPVKSCMELSRTITEDFIITTVMSNPQLGWSYDNDTLSIAA